MHRSRAACVSDSYCTGKEGVPGCGGIGGEGSATEASAQDHVIEIPSEPVIAKVTTSNECTLGTTAIALNGVSIYNGAVNQQCELVDVDDSTAEWTSFDMCSGHAAAGGDYHYHFPPSCLIEQAEAANPTSDGHSPQIGWAFDGFPIYGPLGPGGVKMAQSQLDSCGGKQQELPDLDRFKYRYYFTGDTSNLYALPGHPKPAAADYPFMQACNVGCTWAELSAQQSKCVVNANGATSGVAAGYVATAHAGYADKFAAYGTSGVNYLGNGGMTSRISNGCCGPCPTPASPSPSPPPPSISPPPPSPSPSYPPAIPSGMPQMPPPPPTPPPSPAPSPSPSPSPSPPPSDDDEADPEPDDGMGSDSSGAAAAGDASAAAMVMATACAVVVLHGAW